MARKRVKGQNKIVGVAIVTAICLMGDAMLYIALPLYWKEVGLQAIWEIGLILAINRLIRIPLNPFVGWLYKFINIKTGLIIAVLLAMLTTLGYGIFQGLIIWIVLRCIWGLAWSFLRLGGFFTVMESTSSENAGQGMGLYNGIYRLGSLAGMLAGAFLPYFIGFQSTAIVIGLMIAVGIPLILYIYADTSSDINTSQTDEKLSHISEVEQAGVAPVRLMFSSIVLLTLISGTIVAMLFQGVLASTLTYVIDVKFGYVELLSLVIGAATLSGVLQAMRWGWEPFLAIKIGKLSDGKRGRYPYFLTFLFVSGIMFALMMLPLPPFVWVMVVIVLLLNVTGITTLQDAIALDIAKKSNKRLVMTWYSVATDLGAALGPLFAYIVFYFSSGMVATYYGAMVLSISLVCVWLVAYYKIIRKSTLKPCSQTSSAS